jgi:hypothetical protein
MYKFSHTVKSFSSDSERYIYRNIKNNIFYISPVSPYKDNFCKIFKKNIFTSHDIGHYYGEAFDADISKSYIFMDGEEFY